MQEKSVHFVESKKLNMKDLIWRDLFCLKMLHGKAKDEQWNNYKRKIIAFLTGGDSFSGCGMAVAFLSRDLNITARHTAHGILYIWECSCQVLTRFKCMRRKL